MASWQQIAERAEKAIEEGKKAARKAGCPKDILDSPNFPAEGFAYLHLKEKLNKARSPAQKKAIIKGIAGGLQLLVEVTLEQWNSNEIEYDVPAPLPKCLPESEMDLSEIGTIARCYGIERLDGFPSESANVRRNIVLEFSSRHPENVPEFFMGNTVCHYLMTVRPAAGRHLFDLACHRAIAEAIGGEAGKMLGEWVLSIGEKK